MVKAVSAKENICGRIGSVIWMVLAITARPSATLVWTWCAAARQAKKTVRPARATDRPRVPS